MGSRIIGGTEVPAGKYPFAAALILNNDPLAGQFCGGSLITPQVVLTAAHCFFGDREGTDASDVSVVLGCSDIDFYYGTEPCQVIPVLQSVLHPLYDPSVDESNDAALLQLSTPSTQPVITLAKARPQVGDIATVIGWGTFDEFGYGYYFTFGTTVLREVNVAITGNEACELANEDFIQFLGYNYDFPITEEMICGIGDGQDSCQGDSGGALFLGCESEDNKEVQVGIVSFGVGCAVEGVPGVYASVSQPSVFNFIEQEALNLGGVGIEFTEDLDGFCSLPPLNVVPTPFPTRDRNDFGTGPGYYCSLNYLGANDGCDCDCGTPDPDCQTGQSGGYYGGAVFNCDPGQFCFNDQCVDEIPDFVATLPPRRTNEPTENPTVARTQNPTTSPTELATESPSEADVETDAPTVRDDGGLDPPTKDEEEDDANQEVLEIVVLVVLLLVLCLLLLLCYCCLCKTKPKAEKDAQPQASSLVA